MKEKNNQIIIALSVIVIGLLAAIVFITASNSEKSPFTAELPANVVGEKMINYINDRFLDPGEEVSLVEVADEGSVYRIRLNIMGAEFDSFASKDGSFLFPEGFDLREDFSAEGQQVTTGQDPSELSSIDVKDMTEFVGCLKGADFVIYGANWCGWTTQLVNMLGGWEAVGPVYIECTEEADLCKDKEIMGYPTILINGQLYQGERSFSGFSEATGCREPAGSENQSEVNPAGGC